MILCIVIKHPKFSDGYISLSVSRFISADDIYSPLLDLVVNMESLQGNKRTTLVTTITAVLVIGMTSATIADAQALPMMGGTPQPGGGMMGHSNFDIVHHIKHHIKHHMFGKGHMSPNMGSQIHAPAY